jgi:hypothetical protein
MSNNEKWTMTPYNSTYRIMADGIEQTRLNDKDCAEILLHHIKQIESKY